MNRKTIFITGATGKIGRRLIDKLDFSKYDVYILCKDKGCNFILPLKVILGDLLDPGSYSSVFESHIDIVVHLGAITHTNRIDRYYRINAEATRHLIRLCESNNVKKFIFISTRAISGDGGHYSKSKLMAEGYIRESRLDWVIMRLAEVYGVSDGKGVDFILNSIKKMPIVPIIGNGKYGISPVHVSDAVLAIIKVIEKDELKNKIYNIAGPENFTYNEFIDRVLELYKVKKIKIHIPGSFVWILLKIYFMISRSDYPAIDQLPRLFSDKLYDISEASRELGFNPLSLEDFIGKNGRI